FKPQRRRGTAGAATPSLFRARAKVADFGLARLVETQQLAASGGGTSAYMAPEGWRGCTLPQSDLYSLAPSYVELRLGRPLFPFSNPYTLKEAHAAGRRFDRARLPSFAGFRNRRRWISSASVKRSV